MKKKHLLSMIERGEKVTITDIEIMKIEKVERMRAFYLGHMYSLETALANANFAATQDESDVLEAMAEAGQIPTFSAVRTVTYTMQIAAWSAEDAEARANDMDNESWNMDEARIVVDPTPCYYMAVGYHIVEPGGDTYDLCVACADVEMVNDPDNASEVTRITIHNRRGHICSLCEKAL